MKSFVSCEITRSETMFLYIDIANQSEIDLPCIFYQCITQVTGRKR